MNHKKNVSQSDLLHPAIQDQGGIAIERASCLMNARQMFAGCAERANEGAEARSGREREFSLERLKLT
jgi:hypothetical protein